MGLNDRDREEADHREWLMQEGITAHEEAGLAWQARFERQQREQQVQSWGPSTDRRLFAVDGDLAEQARKDAASMTLPGDAA